MSDQAWLRSTLPVQRFDPGSSNEQGIAELLARVPWLGFSNQEFPFRWTFVDRPESGTGVIAFFNPPHRPPPPDGLRYLHNVPERVTTTTHVVMSPTSPNTPHLSSDVTIELTCHTAFYGHLPPVARSAPLDPNSIEMKLCRFRKRYHISRGAGHPGLWLYLWGRDDHGGAGVGQAPSIPPGWHELPIRNYPLPTNSLPTNDVFIFASRNRPPAAPNTILAAPSQPQRPFQPVGQTPGASYAPSAGAPPPPPGPGQQRPQNPSLMMLQQQAAAAQAGNHPVSQQGGPQQPPYANSSPYPSTGPAGGYPQRPGSGVGGGPVLIAPHTPTASTTTKGRGPGRKNAAQLAAAAAAQAAAAAAASSPASNPRDPLNPEEDGSPHADIFDTLNARQLAITRYATQHDLLADVFDARKIEDVFLINLKEMNERNAVGSNPRIENGLSGLASTLSAKTEMSLEERKIKLEEMKRKNEEDIEAMKTKFEETKRMKRVQV